MKNNSKKNVFIVISLGLAITFCFLITAFVFMSQSDLINDYTSQDTRVVALQIKKQVEDYYAKNNKVPEIEEIVTEKQKKYFDTIYLSTNFNSDSSIYPEVTEGETDPPAHIIIPESSKRLDINPGKCDGFGTGCTAIQLSINKDGTVGVTFGINLYTCSYWGDYWQCKRM